MTPAWETPPIGPSAVLAQAVADAVPVLVTPRTRLRAMAMADFDAWADILCSERAWGMDGPYTRDEAWDEFAITAGFWALHGFGFWTITRRADGGVLGFAGLNMEVSNKEPELGYFLTARAEGRGYAGEAVAAARDWARGQALPSLVSYIDPANLRSVAVVRRLGARRDPAAEAAYAETDDADIAVWRHWPMGGS